jgi:hypothetical protein
MRRPMLLGAAALASATLACGSNHSTAPSLVLAADTATASPPVTGYVLATAGVGSAAPQRTWIANDSATVGDNNGTVYPSSMRGVISFTLPTLPGGATFHAAFLDITQCQIDSNPFDSLGTIVADHLFPTGAPDSATYDTTAIANAVATVATAPTTTPASISLTASVGADYAAGRTTSQYRLRFSIQDTDTDPVTKRVVFCPPTLVVTYVR